MRHRRPISVLVLLVVSCLALIIPMSAFAGPVVAPPGTGATVGLQVGSPAALGADKTSDSLYVGDESNGSVQRFDATTGGSLGAFVAPGSGGLDGPRGIIFDGNLLVSNQKEATNPPSEIDRYNHVNGSFLGALVPSTSAHAPASARGILRGPDNRTLYVADIGPDYPASLVGAVHKYDVHSGHFLGDLDFSSFINNPSLNPTGEFRPRGLVIGPDRRLYVTLFSEINPLLAWILSYNFATGAVNVVASYNPSATDCRRTFHRPEGVVFSPHGSIYVTSFRADSNDIDRILTFNRATGACVGEIDLDQVGQLRAFAQALLFGPSGYLFVPISGGGGPDQGAVRRYDVNAQTYTDFVAPGVLGSGWYLTFGETNPTTLAYDK